MRSAHRSIDNTMEREDEIATIIGITKQ